MFKAVWSLIMMLDVCTEHACLLAAVLLSCRSCGNNQACERERKADCAALQAAIVSAMATRFG
jgi:hypothetical protein